MSMLNLNSYTQAILVALISFPFVAGMLTLPFTIRNYRRFGGISILRTLIFYSFVLYMLCAFLLTVLPLPARHEVAAREAVKVCLTPFYNLFKALRQSGFDRNHLSTFFSLSHWKSFFISYEFFTIFSNCIMLLPFGVYLRYFFRCDLKKTLLLSFLLSFFYEFTQYTGLYFIYPHAYRCPDINDLITNTFGGYLGYKITPMLTALLPTRDELDELSRKSGQHVTLFRELIAAALDLFIICFAIPAILAFAENKITGSVTLNIGIRYMPVTFLLYFSVLQYFLKGQTFGKKIVRIKAVRAGGEGAPAFFSYFVRYFFLYFVYPFFAFADLAVISCTVLFVLVGFDKVFRFVGVISSALMLLLTALFIVRPLRKTHTLPHDYYSGIEIVPLAPKETPVTNE